MELDDYRPLISVSAEDEKKLLPLYELFKNHKYPNVEIVYEKCTHPVSTKSVYEQMQDLYGTWTKRNEHKKLMEDLCKMWKENEEKYKTDGSTKRNRKMP